MRSIDASRNRPAPRGYRGVTLDGQAVEEEFMTRTLVVAIKEDCLGCLSVVRAPADVFGDVATLLVAASASAESSWRDSAHRVVVSGQLLAALDVRWPPFYVLIDPEHGRVVCEGVVFSPEQVREEITTHLARG